MAAPALKTVLSTREVLYEAAKTKAGIVGFGMLILLIVTVAYVPIYAPYDVVRAWGSFDPWKDNPRLAAPEWVDYFTPEAEARSVIIAPDDFVKSKGCNPEGTFCTITITRSFEWNFDKFPSEVQIRILAIWGENASPPQVQATWERPDGEVVNLFNIFPDRRLPDVNTISVSQDPRLREDIRQWALGLGAEDQPFIKPGNVLFAQQGPNMMNLSSAELLRGRYTLQFKISAFSEADEIDAQFLAFGTVYGLAGTDESRRDLMVGLLWGAPVALAFGTAAALLTVFAQVLFGALGAYYGGRWDELVQRWTDFFLILPVLPVLILVGAFYQVTIWHVLFIVVGFSLVGGASKVIRSIVLQVKEDLYIEAAQSYGASRGRILFRYIMPRTLPYTFALIALSVPGFIFLEAALAFLGLSDPVLPTWGKILGDAYREGAIFSGSWWWIAFPALGILFVTVGFAFLGYAFDKILNPRLREE
jgi:peptide/nickel transport system permease protein